MLTTTLLELLETTELLELLELLDAGADDATTLDADDAGAELATEDATDDAGADDATTLAADDAGAELTTAGDVEPPPPPQAERASINETIALAMNNDFVLDTGFMISLDLKIVRIKHNVQTVLRIGAVIIHQKTYSASPIWGMRREE